MAVGSARRREQLELRLLELGFIAGRADRSRRRGRPGRDPFVVRVGSTTFALRRCEVETVWVELTRPSSPT